jgi:excisionase family DNA binding protein
MLVSQADETLPNETYTVTQAGEILGLTRNAAYRAVARGQIPVVRFGDRTLRVPRPALERLLADT